jgi:hypothetical protein
LGGQGTFLAAGEWRVGLAYRHLHANEWFVGKDVREDLAPYGQPLFLNIDSLDATIERGLTDRLSLQLTIPFSYGTHSRQYSDAPDSRHEVSARGLGDVSLIGRYWLFDPKTHANGNVSVGLGIKPPTGKNDVEDDYWLEDGTKTRHTVDQSIQLGDGGWGVLLELSAFQRLFENGYGYAYGSYLVSTRNQTEVKQGGTFVDVPDVYSYKLGVSYAGIPVKGLSVSLGGRIDGIPIQDLFGNSIGFRRPAIVGYVDPGLVLTLGRGEITLNLPVRVWADFRPSIYDKQSGADGGGDLAKVLILVGYNHRF